MKRPAQRIERKREQKATVPRPQVKLYPVPHNEAQNMLEDREPVPALRHVGSAGEPVVALEWYPTQNQPHIYVETKKWGKTVAYQIHRFTSPSEKVGSEPWLQLNVLRGKASRGQQLKAIRVAWDAFKNALSRARTLSDLTRDHPAQVREKDLRDTVAALQKLHDVHAVLK